MLTCTSFVQCSTLAARNVSEVSPWQTAAGYLSYISSILSQSGDSMACHASLQRYVRASIIQPGLSALASGNARLAASKPSAASSQALKSAWAVQGRASSANGDECAHSDQLATQRPDMASRC